MTTRPQHQWALNDSEMEKRAVVSLFSPRKLDRPIRVAVISNPASGNNLRRKGLSAVLDVVRQSRAAHVEEDTLDGLIAATQRLLQDGVELIVVNGGDGTVQAVLTGIFRAPRSVAVPVLAVLPGGTTNTTAHNVGYAATAGKALAELLAGAERGELPGRIEKRPVLRVERGAQAEPLYAMFFGAGAVYHGIRFSKAQVESRGLRGQLGAGVVLGLFIWRVLSGRTGELFPPLHATTTVDGGETREEELFGILASTMDRQFLGLRPYWGKEAAPIHYSWFSYAVRHPARAAIPIMRGKPNRFVRPEFGYRSCNAFRIELEIDSGFTLDGELFDGNVLVRLSAEESALFLRRAPA